MNEIRKEITSIDGKVVIVTDAQFHAIAELQKCRSGGMATVHNYKPSTGIIEQPIHNITMITKISVKALYERKINALKLVNFEDIAKLSKDDEKLNKLPASELLELFNIRRDMQIKSMEKTLAGDRTDNYRKAHDENYAHFAKGFKANVTLLENGKYIIKSILLTYLELNKKVITKGSYKIVNSGVKVLMSNLIKKLTNQKSHGIKTLSLKEDNFTSLKIDRKELKPTGLNENPKKEFDNKLALLLEEFSYLLV